MEGPLGRDRDKERSKIKNNRGLESPPTEMNSSKLFIFTLRKDLCRYLSSIRRGFMSTALELRVEDYLLNF